MEKRERQSQLAKMPLLELVITIGIFAVISVFLLELFLAANSLQQKARDTGKATILSENIAENIKGAEKKEKAIEELGFQTRYGKWNETKGVYPIAAIRKEKQEGDTQIYIKYCDSKWKATKQKSSYSIILVPAKTKVKNKTIDTYEIYVYRLKGYVSMFHQKKNIELFHMQFLDYYEKMED